MRGHWPVLLLVSAAAGLVACDQTDPIYAASSDLDDSGDVLDEEPPVIEHEPMDAPHSASNSLSILATMLDDTGILVAGLHFRTQTELTWQQRGMAQLGPELWQATLDSGDLTTAGMHYYLEAVDLAGNIAVLPEEAPFEYFKFDLVD